MSFMQALHTRWHQADSLVCVGLDPEPAKFPAQFAHDPDAVFNFCRAIVDATAEYACGFKPQIAHFAALGAPVFACTPDLFPDLMATALRRGDVGAWAAAVDIAVVAAAG